MSAASWIFSTLFASTTVLAAGWVCALLLRSRPAWENAVWRTVLISLVLLPLAPALPKHAAPAHWERAPWRHWIDRWDATEAAAAIKMGTPVGPAQAVVRGPVISSVNIGKSLSLFEGLLWIWVAGSGLCLVKLAIGLMSVRRLVRRVHTAASDESIALLEDCSRTAGVVCPALRMVENLPCPVLVGWLHPAILVPASEAPSREMLLHELAHLKRADLWWMTLARIVAATLWFHPLVWRLSRRVESSAEELCDDLVVLWTENATDYAAQLMAFARNACGNRRLALGVAVAGIRSALGRRVIRLLESDRVLRVSIGRGGTILLAAGVACSMLFAAAPEVPKQQAAPASPASKDAVIRELQFVSVGPEVVSRQEAEAVSGLHEGSRYNARETAEATRRLFISGRFANVRIFGKAITDGAVRVVVFLKSKESAADPSAGASSDVGSESMEVLDGVAAVVNDSAILFSELREVIGDKEAKARAKFSGEELKKQVAEIRLNGIDDLIHRELVLQEFARIGATIPEHVVDERVNSIITEEFHGDRAAFEKTLRQQGTTEPAFRQSVREKTIVQSMAALQTRDIPGARERDERRRDWFQELRTRAKVRVF